jgi:hypothetical protein
MVNTKRNKTENGLVKYFIRTKENLKHVRVIVEHYKTGKIANIKGAERLINNLSGEV